MIKYLITGGAGFIGYHLANALSKDSNNRITLVDNLYRGRLDPEFAALSALGNVEFLQLDLTNPQSFNDLDVNFHYVFHLAAVIGVDNVLKYPQDVLRVNSLSSIYMMDFLKRQKQLRRFVFSSTSEIYADTHKFLPIPIPTPEIVPLAVGDISDARGTYALSKMLGEALAHHYGKAFDIPYTILRPHNIYGPRMGFKHVIPQLIAKASGLFGQNPELLSPNHTRAFCYVDDAVEMFTAAATSPGSINQTLNIGNEQDEIQIKDLAEKIKLIAGSEVRFSDCPNPGSPSRRCPDMRHTNKIIGRLKTTDLDEGIVRTYRWYKDRLTEFDLDGVL